LLEKTLREDKPIDEVPSYAQAEKAVADPIYTDAAEVSARGKLSDVAKTTNGQEQETSTKEE
jgi:hypothetical protein